MFKFLTLTLAAMLTFSNPAFANHSKEHNHADMNAADLEKSVADVGNAAHTVTVNVNGLVCDFCARALEKVFSKRGEVSGIDVNLDTKKVTIGLKEGTTIDDATLTELITDAGYNVVNIER